MLGFEEEKKKTNSMWLESHLFSVCSVHINIEKGSPFLEFLSLWWPRRRCRWCGSEWVLLALLDWYFCSPSLAKGGGAQLLHSCIYIRIHKISMMWRFIINVTAPWVASFNNRKDAVFSIRLGKAAYKDFVTICILPPKPKVFFQVGNTFHSL